MAGETEHATNGTALSSTYAWDEEVNIAKWMFEDDLGSFQFSLPLIGLVFPIHRNTKPK